MRADVDRLAGTRTKACATSFFTRNPEVANLHVLASNEVNLAFALVEDERRGEIDAVTSRRLPL